MQSSMSRARPQIQHCCVAACGLLGVAVTCFDCNNTVLGRYLRSGRLDTLLQYDELTLEMQAKRVFQVRHSGGHRPSMRLADSRGVQMGACVLGAACVLAQLHEEAQQVCSSDMRTAIAQRQPMDGLAPASTNGLGHIRASPCMCASCL